MASNNPQPGGRTCSFVQVWNNFSRSMDETLDVAGRGGVLLLKKCGKFGGSGWSASRNYPYSEVLNDVPGLLTRLPYDRNHRVDLLFA